MDDHDDCSVDEAAERLGVHPTTVRRMARAGALASYRLNPANPRSHRRILVSSVDAMIAARKEEARQP